MARYRWPTVIVAASGAVLSGFALWWIFLSYSSYRSVDYTKVSEGAVTGTCIEAVSTDQLKFAWYDTDSWRCNTNSKEALQILLGASVHVLYDKHTNGVAFTGDSKTAYDAVLSAVQGTDSGYKITREIAYDMLAAIGTPTTYDCATLYGVSAEVAAPAPVDVAVVCDADVPTVNTAPAGVTADIQKLHDHCVTQFSFQRSYPKWGSMGIPVVGEEVKPLLLPLVGVNDTTTWEDRARVIVGTRWGYATVFYTLAMLATGFFLMDSTILLLAELTRIDAYFSQNAIVEGNRNAMKEGMMTMLATFQAKRDFRFAIAILLLLLEAVVWFLLVCLPFGWGLEFKRPICDLNDASHWLSPFHPTSQGGWKLDYDAFSLDVIVLVAHLITLIALPIAELAQRGGGNAGQRARTGTGDLTGFTGVAEASLRSSWWFTLLAVGALVFYVGQAVALFRFGVAWAEGVAMNRHNEVAIGVMLHDHINALLYMSITVGLSLGSVIGRWLLAGLSCTSFTIFLMWVLLTLGAFVPPFFVSTYWVFWGTSDSQGQADCDAVFGDSDDFAFARAACSVRLWTYIVGILLLLVAALGPIIIGLFDYSRVVCLPRRRAWVDMPDYWRQLVEPANPKFRTLSQAPGAGNGIAPMAMQPVTGAKAQSDFFAFTTRLTPAAEQVGNSV